MGRYFFDTGLLIDFKFDDLDDISNLMQQWDVKFLQNSTGKCTGTLTSKNTDYLQFTSICISTGVVISGRTPKHTTTFLLLDNNLQTAINSKILTKNEIVYLSDKEDFYFYTKLPKQILIITINNKLLIERYNGLFNTLTSVLNYQKYLIKKDYKNIYKKLNKIFCTVFALSNKLGTHKKLLQIEDHTINLLLNSIFRENKKYSSKKSLRSAELVKEFIDQNFRDKISIFDLCRISSSSQKSIYNGFRELYNTTPLKYIQTLRLNNARRELKVIKRNTNVSDVAISNGFYHFGRFSEYYLNYFGEHPSETLRRHTITGLLLVFLEIFMQINIDILNV